MTKEKSQLQELIRVVSVLQWVVSFLFMGKASKTDAVCLQSRREHLS